MLGFEIFCRNNKVCISRADKLIIAANHINRFIREAINPQEMLRDRDGADFRSVISGNAGYHLQQMSNNPQMSNEEFEMRYNEVTNIGTTAWYGHPLYRDMEDQPFIDNSFFGLLGSLAKMFRSLFTHETYERAPFSSFEINSEIGYEEMIGLDE